MQKKFSVSFLDICRGCRVFECLQSCRLAGKGDLLSVGYRKRGGQKKQLRLAIEAGKAAKTKSQFSPASLPALLVGSVAQFCRRARRAGGNSIGLSASRALAGWLLNAYLIEAQGTLASARPD